MQEPLVVNVLDSRNGLVGYEEYGLDRESPVAIVEKILERWPEKLMDQGIVVAFLTKPSDSRYSDAPRKPLVGVCLGL